VSKSVDGGANSSKTRAGNKSASTDLPDALNRGASVNHHTISNQWRSYSRHHRSSAGESLSRLVATPFASLMTWLVIAIALALPQVLSIALSNVDQLGQNWEGRPGLSVYLRANVKETDGRKLLAKLESRATVIEASYIDPEQGLADFELISGFGDVLHGLGSNPLPAVIQLSLDEDASLEQVRSLQEQITADKSVEQVDVDLQWLQRLQQILELGRRAVWLLAGLLALGVLLIVGNTIRLAIAARKEEILVVKTLGGTNAFVRRPFLYTGIWFGVGGGILALLLTQFCLAALAGPVSSLAGSYSSEYQLQGLSLYDCGFLLLISAVLGWLGAGLAVSRHLAAIEPS